MELKSYQKNLQQKSDKMLICKWFMYWSEGVEQADKEQEHSTVLQPPQEEVSSTKDCGHA